MGARDEAKQAGLASTRTTIFAVGLSALAGIALFALWQHDRQESQPQTNAAQSVAPAPTETATPPKPALVTPTFDVIRVGPQGNMVVAGRAHPEASVAIMDGDEEIGQVKADGRGEWVFTPDQPLKPGRHDLHLHAKLADGRVTEGQEPVVVVVPDAPNGTVLAVKQLDKGGSIVMQGPPTLAGAGPLTVAAVEYNDGRLSASGRAEDGVTIQLYLDNTAIGSAKTDDHGTWLLEPQSRILTEGPHTLRADQTKADGRVAYRVEVSFTNAPATAKVSVTVEPGNSLWRIARRAYGRGSSYTLIYQANKAQIRDPNLIYPGQVFVVPHQ